MTHRYFPHTPEDIEAMLAVCGVNSIDELYSDVPEQLLLRRGYNLPEEMSEKEVRDFFKSLSTGNKPLVCFAGAGYYDHYTPAVVPAILSRSEFLTAYTPYQPEISQGTLQYIFEYQSMMASLTGLDVSNASMYDGTTATAEAMMMMVAATRKRNRVLVSSTLLPQVMEVVKTYAGYHGIALDIIPEKDGITSIDDLNAMLGEDVAGVILATPNKYGILEDYSGVADTIHSNKSLLAMNCVASALGVIKTPGEWGADIAAGDAQSLGMPLNFGGPYLGFLCCKKALIRKLPGRIVGATVDEAGQRSFVLTLQAREQHIRREKATSNICSNQGLMSLFVSVYLSLLGPAGLKEVNDVSCKGARYLADKLVKTGKVKLTFDNRPFFNEFAVTTEFDTATLMERCIENGILPGVALDDHTLLIAVTEMRTRAEIDRLVEIVTTL